MAKTKEPKAGKAPKAGKQGKAGRAPKTKVKGAFLDKVTTLVAVAFGLSLVAQKLVVGGGL